MDNSPTALFDSYEQDFKQIVASVRDKLEGGGGEGERGGEFCGLRVLIPSSIPSLPLLYLYFYPITTSVIATLHLLRLLLLRYDMVGRR